VDDVRGWNFIGGRDGRAVNYDTYEVTRLHARCTGGAAAARMPAPSAAERAQCPAIAAEFTRRRQEADQQLPQVRSISNALARVLPVLRQAVGGDSLTPARVSALPQSTTPDVQQARQLYLQLAAAGITPAAVQEAQEELEARVQFNLNTAFDPRPLVGDSAASTTDRRYGNADVTGPDAKHGTHVAGIIAAVRGNGVGVDGVAPAVRIMGVRAVPNGDERDKDVANAIRYAVDNGAQIINMSFGKGFSPNKALVDAAVKYADAKGVLMVHAAGNDGADVSKTPNFPNDAYASGGEARGWIEVGASSWQGLDSLAAPFTNYGRPQVDVFAPGVDILSTVPGGGYERQDGTSMAAPVVSGVAALLMSYYPSLTAADVKRIILESATRYPDQPVVKPGAGEGTVPFGTLSATGGVVNAYEAVRRAETTRGAQPN
jgi:subtilisin family serine protease